jgi:enoyl-CoA hydratase/carnithine racemase
MLSAHADGPVLRLTLNRPEVRNALNDELIDALTKAYENLPKEIRAVVLTGEGKSFCAGGDLEWMRKAAGYSEDENIRDAQTLTRLFEAIAESPAVTVARVNGHAFGGACGLIAAADVGVADESALFAFSEVRLGLVPATISPFVVEKIGRGHARALYATGEAFDAHRALRIGLVHEVATTEELDSKVEAKLKAILSAGPKAVDEAKKLARSQNQGPDDYARLLARVRASDEGREGISAFLEKRKASFVVER